MGIQDNYYDLQDATAEEAEKHVQAWMAEIESVNEKIKAEIIKLNDPDFQITDEGCNVVHSIIAFFYQAHEISKEINEDSVIATNTDVKAKLEANHAAALVYCKAIENGVIQLCGSAQGENGGVPGIFMITCSQFYAYEQLFPSCGTLVADSAGSGSGSNSAGTGGNS